MSKLTEVMRRHHGALAKKLAEHVAAVAGGTPKPADAGAFVDFLNGELLPHAIGEERHLYPRVDFLLHEYGGGTATMSVDHEFIADYVARIDRAANELRTARGEDARELEAELRRLAFKLEAILMLHLEKEERVYLPLVEKHLPETEQEYVLEEMHSEHGVARAQGADRPTNDVLDVRALQPRERHGVIFETFASLRAAESFVLVNDHDPKPLYYQFQAEHTQQFSWDYLEQGPQVWRVRIGRL
jgi:uncharacterized protein (DUF2249 family)/hemerythrin-like domain-containing protein